MKIKKDKIVHQTASPTITTVISFANREVAAKSKDLKDIIYIFKPFQWMQCIVGMQKVSFNKNKVQKTSKLTALYSVVLAITLFSLQTYIVARLIKKHHKIDSAANIAVDLLNLIPITGCAQLSLFLSATRYQPLIVRLFNNFQLIDHHLHISLDKSYISLRKKLVCILFLLITISVISYGYDSVIWHGDIRLSLSPVSTTIMELTLLEVTIYLYLIYIRLGDLNKQLEANKYDATKIFLTEVTKFHSRRDFTISQSVEKLDKLNTRKGNKKVYENSHDDITRLMMIFDRLADNANIINSCFGVTFLTSAIVTFVTVISSVHGLITVTECLGMVLTNWMLWCFRDVTFIILVTSLVEAVQGRVRKTSNIINKLTISPENDSARRERLERFNMMVYCRSFAITACNFFPFDFSYLYSLVGAVATYSIIIMQTYQSRERSILGSSSVPLNESVSTMKPYQYM